MLAGAAVSPRRPSTRVLAAPLQFLAQLIGVSAISAFLQYVAVRTGRPLIDAGLASFDPAVYFDWLTCFRWVLDHPTALKILSWVYLSLGPQSALICYVAWRNPTLVSQVLAANTLTLTFCLIVFALWPAGGAFSYYSPDGVVSDYVEQFMAARAGLITEVSTSQLKGIIQFPSYHAAAAILFAYAFMSLPRWISIPALLIDATLVVAALPIGGHHLADVLAGVALAALSLVMTLAFSRTGHRVRFQKPVKSSLLRV